jgi:SWIM zinc finger
MSTVSAPARRRPASAPPAPAATVRHGKCSLHLSIGGTRYRLTPLAPPAGFKAVWSLRKDTDDRPATYQVAVAKSQQPACTCPDHEINGAVCKHIGALRALGLIPGRKARPAAARRSHARRLAEPPAEAPAPAPARGPVAAGYARATRAAVSALVGAPEPEPEDFLCAFCGQAFDPVVSRDPHFCGPCAEEGSYK